MGLRGRGSGPGQAQHLPQLHLSSPGVCPTPSHGWGGVCRGQVQMWASSSDAAGSGPSSDCPSFSQEEKKALFVLFFFYLNGLASGLWEALQWLKGSTGWARPGVDWCPESSLLKIIQPLLAKAQKGLVIYERSHSKEPNPAS